MKDKITLLRATFAAVLATAAVATMADRAAQTAIPHGLESIGSGSDLSNSLVN
jgi:hypothetical protein